MTVFLYELVKESQENKHAMQSLIDLFEPKLKKSLSLTSYENREDLAQELKYTLIKYIHGYQVEETPGFYDLKRKIENKRAM